MTLHTQYITNQSGKKTAVILPISEFEELLQDIKDLAGMVKRNGEKTRPLEEVKAHLKKTGLL